MQFFLFSNRLEPCNIQSNKPINSPNPFYFITRTAKQKLFILILILLQTKQNKTKQKRERCIINMFRSVSRMFDHNNVTAVWNHNVHSDA